MKDQSKTPEWEGALTGWRKQFFLRMMRLGMSIYKEEMEVEFSALKSLVDEARLEARNDALESAAEAMTDLPSHVDISIAQLIIRSLKSK